MKIVIIKPLSAEQEAEVDERFAEADKYGSRFFSNCIVFTPPLN